MRPADRPSQARRLAGVDQALGEGQAREPADLLDQLRERLDRLATNHPSARRDQIRPTERPDAPAERPKRGADRREDTAAPPGEGRPGEGRPGVGRPGVGRLGVGRPAEAAGPARSDDPGGQGQGEPGGEEPAFGDAPAGHPGAQFGPGAPGGLPQAPAADGRPGQHGLGRAGTDEPYRPWFAADESGEPWFIE